MRSAEPTPSETGPVKVAVKALFVAADMLSTLSSATPASGKTIAFGKVHDSPFCPCKASLPVANSSGPVPSEVACATMTVPALTRRPPVHAGLAPAIRRLPVIRLPPPRVSIDSRVRRPEPASTPRRSIWRAVVVVTAELASRRLTIELALTVTAPP